MSTCGAHGQTWRGVGKSAAAGVGAHVASRQLLDCERRKHVYRQRTLVFSKYRKAYVYTRTPTAIAGETSNLQSQNLLAASIDHSRYKYTNLHGRGGGAHRRGLLAASLLRRGHHGRRRGGVAPKIAAGALVGQAAFERGLVTLKKQTAELRRITRWRGERGCGLDHRPVDYRK